MDNIIFEQAYALKSATRALYDYIVKLENDGYLNVNDDRYKASEAIITEVAAFSISLILDYNERFNLLSEDLINEYNSIILQNFEGLILSDVHFFVKEKMDKLKKYFNDNSDNFEFDCIIYLENFDKMAQEFEGAFYQNLGVDNPGLISLKLKYLIYNYLIFMRNFVNNISALQNSYFDKLELTLGVDNED